MTEATTRAALIAEAAEYPTDSDWCGNLIQDLAAALADAERDLAKAWDEGHLTSWKRGPSGCKCGAWSAGECGCGLYGTGDVLSLAANPYRTRA